MSRRYRPEVYDVIDKEREYQDKKWGGYAHDINHSPGDWLTFLRVYLNKADQAWTSENSKEVWKYIKKVAALSIAAMEYGEIDE